MKLMQGSIRACTLLSTFAITAAVPATDTTLITPLYSPANAPIVNLGYALYHGYHDPEFGLNIFKGCAATTKLFHLTL